MIAVADAPIEGQVLLLAGTKASVSAARLPDLVERVQSVAGPAIADYRRRFERVHRDDDREVFLVDDDHWDGLGDRLGLDDREIDAVRRAHKEQFLRIGRREDREAEFEAALELRAPMVIGTE